MARKVNFSQAARRHYQDANLLKAYQREANAGQLYGFAVECGLKALLVNHGLPIDNDGDIRRKPETGFRKHLPGLSELISLTPIVPGGRTATRYLSQLTLLDKWQSWSIDQRYFDAAQLPLAELPDWAASAKQVTEMLDMLLLDGIQV